MSLNSSQLRKIELTGVTGPVYVIPKQIGYVRLPIQGDAGAEVLVQGYPIFVKETVAEVLEMIERATFGARDLSL